MILAFKKQRIIVGRLGDDGFMVVQGKDEERGIERTLRRRWRRRNRRKEGVEDARRKSGKSSANQDHH